MKFFKEMSSVFIEVWEHVSNDPVVIFALIGAVFALATLSIR